MKRFIYMAAYALLALIPTASIHAAEKEKFVPLVGIPYVDTTADNVNLGDYVNGLYWAAISIAAILAVLKIIAAGIQYTLADVVTTKGKAKKDIQGAIVGLVIVIAAVLILNTINPTLTQFSLLNLQPIDVPLTGYSGGQTGFTTTFGPEVVGSNLDFTTASDAEKLAFTTACLDANATVNTTTNNTGHSIGTCVTDSDVTVDPDLIQNSQFNTDRSQWSYLFDLKQDLISSQLGTPVSSGDVKGMVSVPMNEIPDNDEMAFSITLQSNCEAVGGSHVAITAGGGNYEFWCVGNSSN